MANQIYTKLSGKNVGVIFKEYKDLYVTKDKVAFVVTRKSTRDDLVQMITNWNTPFHTVAQISKQIENEDLVHLWCDNDNYGKSMYENVWNNGKMVKAYVYPFNFEIEDYNEKIEVEPTDKFDVLSNEDKVVNEGEKDL